MSRSICCVLALVCFLALQASQAQDTTILPTDDPPTTSLNSETANNTSACFANNSPTYCNEALPNLTTSSANQSAGAETLTVDAFPEHISTISVKRLMYKNWSGQLICEYQPWFNNTGSLNGHIDIGYDENTLKTVTNQDSTMITRGCNISLIDFYGQKDVGQQFNLTSTNNVYSDLAARLKNSVYPLKFAVLEDENAFKADCTPSGETESQAITCIEDALQGDMDYVYQNYTNVHPGLYWTDQGTNVIGFFGACADFVVNKLQILNCPTDWNTIWTAVQDYVNGKPYNMKFVFEFGNFDTPTISAGEYAWPQPYTDPVSGDNDSFVDNPTSQYWWCDGTGITCTGSSGGYLDQFYIAGANAPAGHISIGLLYSGFDDSNASWTRGRVIGQQCGHVLLDTANEVTKGGYWGAAPLHQIPYMQIATWNDYEEATEEESGIDNCYTAVNLSLVTGTTKVSWTLTTNGDINAKTDTIHHFALWTAPHGTTTLTLRGQLVNSTTQYDMSTLKLTPGSYDVYVEMVGQPSMQNEMSNTVEYTQN